MCVYMYTYTCVIYSPEEPRPGFGIVMQDAEELF